MSQTLSQHDFNRLLEELEQRILSQPLLAAEYESALDGFLAGSADDAPTRLRFREWFLMEHTPPSLGAPPAVTWAPEDLQAGDIWQRLLESFFGIFQESGCDENQRPIMQDLWSGREIRLDRPLPASDENLVVVGRCAQGTEDSHVLFPGCVFLAASGLVDALAADLARIRAEQPRSRLSQRQCERLLLPFRDLNAPTQNAEQALAALEMALAGEPLWDVDRLLATAVDKGTTDALNLLAFETKVDLEPVRTALATLAGLALKQDAAAQEESVIASPTTADDILTPGEIESALAAFELARNSGKDLAESFQELEQSLGLPVGDSDPFAEISQGLEHDAEPLGPEKVPGMSMWLATFLWEKEARGITIKEEEAREISAFMEHLVLTRNSNLDPEQVAAGDLLGYMLRAENLEILEFRLNSLDAFMTWLVEEQASPLGETVAALRASTGDLLRDVVTLNQELARSQARKESVVWLKSTSPLQVEAEDGDLVMVVGVPEGASFTPTVGDCLMGSWQGARFHLGAWLPAQLLPTPSAAAE